VEEPALDVEWGGQGKHEDEALSGAYVLAGQARQEDGPRKIIIVFDATTISASVSNWSQMTTLEKAKSLVSSWFSPLLIVRVDPPCPPEAIP
jgi:hypothetical protein